MNERIKELAVQARIHMCSEPRLQEFAQLVIDMCCGELLEMHEKVNGDHNYYKHAAVELKRKFRNE